MQRLLDAIGWFVEALGRAPLDDELAMLMYREIEFGRSAELRRAEELDAVETLEELRRRAS